MKDLLRPKGTVEVVCPKCDWKHWVDPLHPGLPDNPPLCYSCAFPDAEFLFIREGDLLRTVPKAKC